MSNLNLTWMQENFLNQNLVLFNIGCANISDDTFRFQIALPHATIYSFECSDYWKEENIKKSKEFGFNYVHKAVTDYDGLAEFYEGIPTKNYSEHDQKSYRFRGTLSTNTVDLPQLVWKKQPHTVETISLNTFCREHSLKPNFLHIDVEREEYNILKSLEHKFWPEAIWIEKNAVYNNTNNASVDFFTLDKMLLDRGYKNYYTEEDCLYVQSNCKFSSYVEYNHRQVPMSEFEKSIQQGIWLKTYEKVKDPLWPNLTHPKEFFDLPLNIKQECISVFDLEPLSKIL